MSTIDEYTNKKSNIINAAKKIFAEKGYKSTSMSQIAKATGIAKSLIYYHFKDKAELWKETKLSLVKPRQEEANEEKIKREEILLSKPTDLRSFIEYIVTKRFDLYTDNTLLIKMVNWQSLEDDKEAIKRRGKNSPGAWEPGIIHLQSLNIIDRAIDPEMVIAFIRSATTGVFQENYYKFMNSKKSIHDYKLNIINWLVVALEQK